MQAAVVQMHQKTFQSTTTMILHSGQTAALGDTHTYLVEHNPVACVFEESPASHNHPQIQYGYFAEIQNQTGE